MDAVENIVVVVVDALRADRVGVYGCEKGLTPNIDDLADDGVVFENVFTHTPNTDPSLTSIHTGKYPETTVYHHGHFVTDEEKQRVEAAPWFPEALSDDGWNTVTAGRPMGRWHRRGFDTYPSGGAKRRAGSVLRSIHPAVHGAAKKLYQGAKNILDPAGEKSDAYTTQQYMEAVDSEPFYLFVHMMDTHTGYEPAPRLVDQLLEQYDYPETPLPEFVERLPDGSNVPERMERWIDIDDDVTLGRALARYDGAVKEADRKIGRMIDALQERGLWENTAFFVLSDHGESLTEHGIYFSHHGLYDQTMHIPLIARIPGVTPQTVSEFVQLTDIAPTALDLAGLDRDEGMDGQSLVPLVTAGGGWEERDAVYANETFMQTNSCIRTDTWKFIRHDEDERMDEDRDDPLQCRRCGTVHRGERELYDLEEDPAEENNVVGEQPGKAEELEERLDARLERLSHPEPSGQRVEYGDEEDVKQRLEDLGYM